MNPVKEYLYLVVLVAVATTAIVNLIGREVVEVFNQIAIALGGM
jgi:Flp pilus assembly pilin Flp